ncbi:DsbA family oxidoreductase [Actinomadura atramentaria]|uniref:DsbA family oxidoreductase n=1 Tax=Actinomadura atramentaria TaxID=1990 RepID=UPI000366C4A2|nr:DsbA family oxidoreductase [Actinomadura atramentaria]
MRVEIWSDLVCPWCYIGKRRFEKALAAFPHRADVEVVHRSFQLDPSAPAGETRDQADMLAEKFGLTRERAEAMNREMEARAAQDGLEYNLAGGLSGNTADAHRLVHLARESGRADDVVEALYKAHFTDRRSIFDTDSLVEVAAEAGLDADAARATLESGAHADAVRADHAEAQRLGATGVPFFVVDGRYGVSGAQPVELFTQVLERAWDDARPQLVTGPGEVCDDGTCAVPEA